LAALAAGAFHALVEFPFHITGFALTYAALAALAYLILHHHPQTLENFSYPVAGSGRWRRAAFGILLALLLCQTALSVRAWHWWRAETAAPTEPDSTRPPESASRAEDFRRALGHNPRNSASYAGLAALLQENDPAGAPDPQEVEHLWRAAVQRAPAEWFYRYHLGEFYLGRAQDSPRPYLPLALQELAAAVSLFPASGRLHFRLGTALAWAEEYYGGLVPPQLRNRAGYHLELALQLEPRLQKLVN
jgi:hypothetical protein